MSPFCRYLGCTPKYSTKIIENNKTADIAYITNLQHSIAFLLIFYYYKAWKLLKKIRETSQCPHLPHYLFLLYLYLRFFSKTQ